MSKKKEIETLLAHHAEDRHAYHGAVVPPIFQNSLFTFKDWDAIDEAFDNRIDRYIYSRGKNPTVKMVEEKIAIIAGGEKAQLFPSGMAAITAACFHFLQPNDHVITIKNVYGPANNLLTNYLSKKMGVTTTFVSGKEVSAFAKAIQENTTLIYLESPSSAVFSLQNIREIALLAKRHGIKTMIDNTWATPLYQQPLSMGIDLEVHSTTKYIGGHSDLVGGVVIGKTVAIDAIFHNEYELLGMKTAPMEAWLLLRSLRTLPMRLAHHQASAMKIAQYLEGHSKITKVNYPGLASFEQYELGKQQMSGYTGLFSFQLETSDIEKIKSFFNGLELFLIGVSWGGHESLIYAPAISYLKELSPEQFTAMGISLGDIRISVGLENVDDLIHDLEQALALI